MSENRTVILDAARQILTEVPASAFSSREVARKAGVSVGVVHYHFQSRQGLMRAAYDAEYYQGLLRLVDDVRAELGAGEDFEELLIENTLRVFRFCRSRGQLYRNFLSSIVERGDLGHVRELEGQDRMLRLVAPFVAQHAKISMPEARLRLSCLTMLVARLAASSESELRLILEVSDDTDVVAIAEKTLGETARRIVLGP